MIHLGKKPADAAQYQPVNRRKSKSPGIGTPQHIDLLPQHHDLCLERCARPQQIDHRPKDQFTQINVELQHRPILNQRPADWIDDRDSYA